MAGRHPIRIAGFVALLVPFAATPQSGGQADIAVQGYYLSGRQQSLSDTSGLSMRFQQFLPKFGLLDGVVENYGSQGRWRQGDNSLQLRGLAWLGYRWTLAGGDFRVSPLLTTNPFTNIYYPELNLRGAKIETTRGNASFSLFYGAQTLFQGPRIPFRMKTGEFALGATVRYRLGESLQLGLRIMRLTAEPGPGASFLFPLNRRFDTVNNAALQALYHPSSAFSIFAEASASVAAGKESNTVTADRPLSFFVGAAYESQRVTARANYSDQGVFYLPIAGYFAGDRRGPFGEIRVRPFAALELFASASEYRNNREHNRSEATFTSQSGTAGLSLRLPSRFTLSAQLTRLRFESSQDDTTTRSNNQQWTATLNRPVGRNNFRLTYRDMRFTTNSRPGRQVSREFEDMLQFRRLVVGGAVRLDSTLGTETRNTVFTRASAQLRLSRVTAYSYFDIGRDVVNRSVFSTNAVNSTILGATTQLPGNWSFQVEAFRNTLTMMLNPGNVFLLQSQGVTVPATFAGLDQWSLFVRVSKQLRWGESLPIQGLDRYTAERIPITGIVEGEVFELNGGTRRPVAGIPVTVDGSRTSLTNASGAYRLEAIPEGQHEIALLLTELPANFDPGSNHTRTVLVSTRRTTQLDFEVIRLAEVCGQVLDAPDPLELGTVVIRLRPTANYTTPETDGSFCFHNLRPGRYQVELDTSSLPPLTQLSGPNGVAVQMDPDRNRHAIEFHLRKVFESKPVRRRVLEDNPASTPEAQLPRKP